MDAFVLAEMARQRIPGLSLAVVRAGKVVKAKGYGFADLERSEPVGPETVFKIGSVSKQFLATGIMLLAQDGKLSVDDPISKYLAGTPASWSSITTGMRKSRNLLPHLRGDTVWPVVRDETDAQRLARFRVEVESGAATR